MKESNKDQYLLKSLDSALTVLQLFVQRKWKNY